MVATARKTTSKKAAELTAIAEVKLVPLELIDTPEQLRKNFDQESIEELARDIQERGLLQPILLNPAGNRFQLIAGERRLRAIKLTGASGIPALLTKASWDKAVLMQLAENIQRENLSLEEQSQAIKTLYDMLGNLDKVADAVKKSKPWCSKRYAMMQKLNYPAKELLEDGITEDIELLQALSKLCELEGWATCKTWDEKIRTGNAGREDIRAALKAAKEKKKTANEKTAEQAGKVSHAKLKEQRLPPPWSPVHAMDDLNEALTYADTDKSALDLLDSYTPEQQGEILARLTKAAEIGAGSDGFKAIGELVIHGLYNTEYTDIDLMAMIAGFRYGKLPDARSMLAELQCPREKA
jgi:ParB/RepB/Spo0J family partition protein